MVMLLDEDVSIVLTKAKQVDSEEFCKRQNSLISNCFAKAKQLDFELFCQGKTNKRKQKTETAANKVDAYALAKQ
jgi:hypothetical protein